MASGKPKINEKSRQILSEKHQFYDKIPVEDRLQEY